MDDLLAARLQMALTLGFHIIFASIGMAMPFFMAVSHWLYLSKGDESYRIITKSWSKGVAIFFAVGAVSGTALSFELGLLWPGFMKYAGPIIGMPFSWEGTAFFIEAIALGIFLYGWGKISPWVHWMSGVVVGIAGVLSGLFVICANSWMNNPVGFDWNNGDPQNIDPWAAMFNEGALTQGIHMVIASFVAVGFAVGGLHAFLFLKTRYKLHLQALKISFVIGAIAALFQPLSGDILAKMVAKRQPLKLAAMEAHFETKSGAPLILGGIVDEKNETVTYALELPKLLSFLAYGDFNATVKGLKSFPRELWPPVAVVHTSFQVMIALGMILVLVSIVGLFLLWRSPQRFISKFMLSVLSFCAPLGFLAIEAGWTVTEVGRQPWIIYGLLKTSEALTPRPGVVYTFITFTTLYGFLALVVTVLMVRQIRFLHKELRQSEQNGKQNET